MVVVPPTIKHVEDSHAKLHESGYGEMKACVSRSSPKFIPDMESSSVLPDAGRLLGAKRDRTGASNDIIRADVAWFAAFTTMIVLAEE